MIYGSVCSGIEAATVAWHHLGWKAAFYSDIEPFPRAVLAHHYPDVPCHGDFTTIEPGQYPAIDLLVGGTPCQDFSVAGLRAGLAGERGALTIEFVRLAERLRPKWLVWENVPGVLSADGGRAFGAFLGALAERGYHCAWRVLDAQYAGVPQRRRRVFVVGYLGDWRRPAAVLFERHSLSGDPPPRRKARERVAPCLDARAEAGGAGWGTDFMSGGGLAADCEAFNPTGHGAYAEGVGTLRSAGGDVGAGSETLVTGMPEEEPMTFDWQVGDGGNDTSFRGKSRAYITDKPGGPARSLTANHQLAVHIPGDDDATNDGVCGTLFGSGAGTERPAGTCSETDMLVYAPEVCPTLRSGGNETGGDRPPGTDVDTSDSLLVYAPDVAAPLMTGSGHEAGHRARSGMGKDATLLAFTQNQREEVRDLGEVADALHAERGTHEQTFLAFSNTAGDTNLGIDEESDAAPPVTARHGDPGMVAFAFKPSHYTRDKDGAPSDVVPPLSADADKGDQDTVLAIRNGGRDADERPGRSAVTTQDDTMFALQAEQQHAVAFSTKESGKDACEDLTPSLRAESGDPHMGGRMAVAGYSAVRRLTPCECERLMGFPDDYTQVPYRGKPAADGPRYRALGNSMVVDVMRWIGERIQMVEDLKKGMTS